MLDKAKRENEVLQLIVSHYIGTAEPVGSRLIAKKLGLSSATIRNVMQDLEEMGLIAQPHASAGRIPTEKGYRYYVDMLLHMRQLTEKQIDFIESEYHHRLESLEELLTRTSHILSQITQCAGIAIFPKVKERSFRHIALVPFAGNRVIVMLVTASGSVKDFIIELDYSIARSELDQIANFLNAELFDMTLGQVREYLLKKLKAERDSTHRLVRKANDLLSSVMMCGLECDLYLDGASHIFSQPEFRDPRKVTSVLKLLEEKRSILGLLSQELEEKGLRVHIGKENKLLELRDFSLITKQCMLKDKAYGRLGVIGLVRMNYDRIIPIVDYLAGRVSKALSEWDTE